MDDRRLGAAGPGVSPVGFGAFKIGRNQKTKYGHTYDLPSEREVGRLIEGLLEVGINYFDTAPAYGESELRLGRLLHAQRDQIVISTKVGERFENGESSYDFSRTAIEASVDKSLQHLQTDVLDVVFLHSPGNDLQLLMQTDAVDTLRDLRTAGKIKAIGLSAKTVEGAQAALEWADVLMVEYHLQDLSQTPVIAAAAAQGIGVVVKKGLAAGHLPIADAMRFVLANPGVSSLVIGSLSLDHMRDNFRLAKEVIASI